MTRRTSGGYASFSLKHPILTTTLVAVATVVLGLAVPRLFIDTSAEGFMAERDPSRLLYDRFKQQFGTDSVTLVVIQADDVFRADVLETVRRLTDELEQADGVVRVESLATARHVIADEDTLENRLLLPPDIPTAPADLAAIRERALGHRVLTGNIVAPDARATAVVVYTDPPEADREYNRHFVDRLEALLNAERRPGVTLYEVGRPLLKATYSRYILRDIGRLLPISTVVLFAALLLLFRSADAVVVPMITVAVSTVWCFGLMALAGIPLNVVTAVIPSLLVTIGFTEDVHIISDYHNRLREGMERKAALAAALDETAAPILVTTVTTGIGFASLGFADVRMLAQFGYGSALGLVGNYFATMALLPTIVMLMPARQDAAAVERHWGERRMRAFLEWLGWFILRRRTAILIAAAVALVIAGVGVARIDVNTDFLSYFPSRDPLRERARDVQEVLTGAESFWVVVDTHRPDGIKEPEVLDRIAKLQAFLAGTGQVDKSVSIVDYLMTINRDLHGGGAEHERVPASREEAAQYLLMVNGRDLASMVNADASTAAVLVRHNVTGSARMKELERRLDAYFASAFPADTAVFYTGEAILTDNAADFMAVNEITSFGFTFAAIAIIHSVLFMSVRIGLLSLVPDLIPIVMVYGLMGFMGVPLSSGTALIATVAIGIAVDDTVHHLMTYARELREVSHPSLAMFATLRQVGRPVFGTSLALAAGFLVMVGSGFVPLQQFGVFGAITMLLALLTELFVTPALMLTVRVVTAWDLVMLKLDPALLAASPCFRGFSQWELRKVILLGGLRSFAPGSRVARRGEPGGGVFLVVTGRLRLGDRGRDREASTDLEPGAVFGELGDSTAVWSTDVVADQPSELLFLDFESLERLRRRFPFTAAKLFRNLATVLSDRLRSLPLSPSPFGDEGSAA